jgi:similar to stage IV sporulation protein
MGYKYNYLKQKDGVLRINVKSKNLERFINLLWSNGVIQRNIIKETINSMSFDVNYSDYNTVIEVAHKTKSKIKIIDRKGIIFLKIRLKKRVAMLLGAFVFVGIIYWLSSYIWGIQISTEKNIAPYEIREELNNIGIIPGTYKKNINVYTIEEKLKNYNPNIMWVRVRVEGSVLKVSVSEREALPNTTKDNSTCNIVAKKDGVITRIYTKAGTAVVKSGDIVKKGQVLIIGEQGNEGNTYKVHASGEVIAKTYYEETREVPLTYTKKTMTGNFIENYYINIFGKKFYLKNSLNKFAIYDKIEKDDNFIKKEIYYEVKEEKVNQDSKTLVTNTADAIYKNINLKLYRTVNVINKTIESNIEGNSCKVRVLVTAEENIADTQK